MAGLGVPRIRSAAFSSRIEMVSLRVAGSVSLVVKD
jgi:hypothetical protein